MSDRRRRQLALRTRAVCAPLDSDGIDGTCEALRSDGQACDNDWECHGWCREGACIDIPAVCEQPELEPPVEPL